MPDTETATPTATPTPPPTVHPAFSNPPAASGASLVQISADEFQRFRSVEAEFGKLQSKLNAELVAKEAERLQALADAGKSREALEEQRKSWESKLSDANAGFNKVRDQYHGKAKSEVIVSSLVGREFAGDKPEVQAKVAQKFLRDIDPLFETIEDATGNLIVREKGTGRPAADAIKELINAPENQHYFAPKSRGGAGTDGTGSASHAQQTDNPHPPGSAAWHGHNYKKSMVNATGLIITPRS
jgi:hypothetical protein